MVCCDWYSPPVAAARLGRRAGAWEKANYKVALGNFVIDFPPNPPLRGGAAAEQSRHRKPL